MSAIIVTICFAWGDLFILMTDGAGASRPNPNPRSTASRSAVVSACPNSLLIFSITGRTEVAESTPAISCFHPDSFGRQRHGFVLVRQYATSSFSIGTPDKALFVTIT